MKEQAITFFFSDETKNVETVGFDKEYFKNLDFAIAVARMGLEKLEKLKRDQEAFGRIQAMQQAAQNQAIAQRVAGNGIHLGK